jgi:REP element-mobilizing transposase RayT
METYDPRKHHRRSVRLPGYDYSQPGYYFVTFCVCNRKCLLGTVAGDTVNLSPLGTIVKDVLAATEQFFWNVAIDLSIIMPNHGHVVYVIHEWTTAMDEALVCETRLCAESSTSPPSPPAKSLIRQPTLGQIVASHKYETTRRINSLRRTIGAPFWQRGFYEHVVHTQRELEIIRQYITDNPLDWALDVDNPRNFRIDPNLAIRRQPPP